MMKPPDRQCGLELRGPDELFLNKSREVPKPGRGQILCKVEAVGLCFSDLKLLKQFSSHVRKSKIVSGIPEDKLPALAGYVPREKTTVPGHEAVLTVSSVGQGVRRFKPGMRCIVQPEYRWLKTEQANAAFGYNFEGALQEYVLMDERAIVSPTGESSLIPLSESVGASAGALLEPWACVENDYRTAERQNLLPEGRLLIVAETGIQKNLLTKLFYLFSKPAHLTWLSPEPAPTLPNISTIEAKSISQLPDFEFDDVLFFGSNAKTVEALFSKLKAKGLLNIVLCGGRFETDLAIPLDHLHYGGIRITGTTGSDPSESMQRIPHTGEVRAGDKINVIGAGGAMGMMQVIRNICSPIKGISVYGGDIDQGRLQNLSAKVSALAEKNPVFFQAYDPTTEKPSVTFDYIILMVPDAEVVASAVKQAGENAIINVFAGIAEKAKIDLNSYIAKGLYFIGTSGSTVSDLKEGLRKVETGKLDTDLCIGGICGLDGAIEGLRSIDNKSTAGKIVVYPSCKGLNLVRLKEMQEKLPEVAENLHQGNWNKKAEAKLLQMYGQS